MEWKRIDGAPTDGSEFQAWVVRNDRDDIPGWWCPRCRFDEHGSFQIYGRVDYDMEDFESIGHVSATHWMPQPGEPK